MDKFTKVLKVLSGILGVVLAGLLFITWQLNKELDDLNSRVIKEVTVAEVVREPAQPIGVLLLGVDSRDGSFNQDSTSQNDSRSDAILVASVNPKTKTTELVSIPRDTLVEIEGVKQPIDKVNHSYMFGGVDLTLETVSGYLDFPIHYVVEINMQGLEDLIDELGGVNIAPSLSFVDNGFEYTEGQSELMSGDKALWYTRMRKKDPKGDIGRGERQQEVIEAIAKKLRTMDVAKNYRGLLEVVKDNLKTNVTISTGFIVDYLPSITKLNKISVSEYQDFKINGVYYLGVSEEGRRAISNRLRNNINLGNTDTDKAYILEQAQQGDLYDINKQGDTYGEYEEPVIDLSDTELEFEYEN